MPPVSFVGQSRMTLREQNDLADELAAFANTRGGVLLLGMHEKTHEVIGIPIDRLNAVETLILIACEDSMEPACAAVIERITLPDSTGIEQPVIRMEAPRSLSVHRSPGGYFHRVGFSKRQMSSEQLARLFQHRSQSRLIRFDETLVLCYSVQVKLMDSALSWRFAARRSAPSLLLTIYTADAS